MSADESVPVSFEPLPNVVRSSQVRQMVTD